MNTYDPDIVRWNLHLLADNEMDVENCKTGEGSPQSTSIPIDEDESSAKDEDGTSTISCQIDPDIVKNDGVIAYILQEELSKLAKAEAEGDPAANHAAVLSQDWVDQRENCSNSGQYSAPPVKLANNDVLSNIADDYSDLDVEVERRLNHMVPVRHVPKVNGEVPSVDEASAAHKRLADRLELYDLVEVKVEGDGNCQFRALSDQVYHTPDEHRAVREQVVQQLKEHPELYEGYVPMNFDDYLKKMARSGEWGDHVTLQAAADWYGLRIFILTSFKETCYIEILPVEQKSKKVICLSFWAEVHYNSVYPRIGCPTAEPIHPGKMKKRKEYSNNGRGKGFLRRLRDFLSGN